jgi:hypothetical protein
MRAAPRRWKLARMPAPRRLLVPLAAVTAALACVPAAHATKMPPLPQHVEFWVSAKGTQTTTWSRNTALSGGDCFYQWSETPKGEETVKFRAKKRKALATVMGKNVLFQYGTWDPYSGRPPYFPATGTTSRRDRSSFTDGPGPCGAKSEPATPPEYDCGTRRRHFDVSLAYAKQHIGLEAGALSGEGSPAFDTCRIVTPAAIIADAISPIWQSWPVEDLGGDFDKQVIQAEKTFNLDDGLYRATTTVAWQMTFVRHR